MSDLVVGKADVVVESMTEFGTGLMEVSEDKLKIRRKPDNPVPTYDDNYKRLQKNRTCYVKVLYLIIIFVIYIIILK